MKTQDKINKQHEIIRLLGKDNTNKCTFHFETTELESGEKQLLLMSYNPHHDNAFLLHDEKQPTEEQCYVAMLKFIQELPRSKDLRHYEVKWHNDDNQGQLETSHFFGHSVFDALKKLYSTRDKNKVRFESMRLRPNS